METLKYAEEGPVAVVSIHRPEAMNAITEEMLGELREVCAEVAVREDLRAMVLAGSDEIFCAGADLKDQAPRLADLAPSQLWRRVRATMETFNAVAQLPQPTVAAVSGYALGGGLEIALACDLRVASPTAQFGLPEARVGMMPAAGGTQRLPRLIGASRALELMLTGARIDAQRAYEIGLVNVVAEDWLGAAVDMARRISTSSPVAAQLCKEVTWSGLNASLEAGLRMELAAVAVQFSTDDRVEGLNAFLEKRKPEWQGR